MGNIITSHDVELGDISKRRWDLMRRLLPVLLEYVNAAMQLSWEPGMVRAVTLSSERAAEPEPGPAPGPQDTPPAGDFMMTRLIDDQADEIDEVFVVEPAEVERLIEWFRFLSARDGAAELLAPVVETLADRFTAR